MVSSGVVCVSLYESFRSMWVRSISVMITMMSVEEFYCALSVTDALGSILFIEYGLIDGERPIVSFAGFAILAMGKLMRLQVECVSNIYNITLGRYLYDGTSLSRYL